MAAARPVTRGRRAQSSRPSRCHTVVLSFCPSFILSFCQSESLKVLSPAARLSAHDQCQTLYCSTEYADAPTLAQGESWSLVFIRGAAKRRDWSLRPIAVRAPQLLPSKRAFRKKPTHPPRLVQFEIGPRGSSTLSGDRQTIYRLSFFFFCNGRAGSWRTRSRGILGITTDWRSSRREKPTVLIVLQVTDTCG